MADTVLARIKLFLRISHTVLDEDIQADIDACMADLKAVGVIYATAEDPLIFNAVKLYCKSLYIDDVVKGAEYLRRYEALKACLMMAEGYGWKDQNDE